MQLCGHKSGVTIGTEALNRLMPMHLLLSEDGVIVSAGATLTKVFAQKTTLQESIAGQAFFRIFEVSRPGGVQHIADLRRSAGDRLSVIARNTGAPPLRGVVQSSADDAQLLLNLSFGIGVIDAVSAFSLTDADFAVTDLAMELLYLVEAKTAVMQELRQLNVRLQGAHDLAQQQALTDTLTGLSNRRSLDRALEISISRGQEFSLMHIDLDFFKAVNDTFGHAAGDFVLCRVGERLLAETRKADVVSRVGGDEFLILLPGITDARLLTTVAARIVERLSEPIAYEGKTCRISASIGIVVSTDYHPPLAGKMLGDADRALYDSKNTGRGRARLFNDGPILANQVDGQAGAPHLPRG